MKSKGFVLILAATIVMGVPLTSSAIPPFMNGFKKKFGESKIKDDIETQKCNVCHEGMDKKKKNEFGTAVGKFLKKGDFAGDGAKYKGDEADKKIAEGLDEAIKEKHSGGKTYKDLIESGKLPGAK